LWEEQGMDKVILNPRYKVVDFQEKGKEKLYTITPRNKAKKEKTEGPSH
jgi:hypothetical protein